MIPAIRKEYNERFSKEAYASYIHELQQVFPGHLDFRVAETPIFIPADFKQKALSACEHIIDIITKPTYHRQSEKSDSGTLAGTQRGRTPPLHCF